MTQFLSVLSRLLLPPLRPRKNPHSGSPSYRSEAIYFLTGCLVGLSLGSMISDDDSASASSSRAADVRNSLLQSVGGSPSLPPFRLTSDNFIAEYDPSRRNPRWVAEWLTREGLLRTSSEGTEQQQQQLQQQVSRHMSSFHEETGIDPTYRVTLADYAGSGYDRGHLSPAADNTTSRAAMDASFSLLNVSPQDKRFNRESWATLERTVRTMLLHRPGREDGMGIRGGGGGEEEDISGLAVITGPLWLPTWVKEDAGGGGAAGGRGGLEGEGRGHWQYSFGAIGSSKSAGSWVPVPTHFFKAIVAFGGAKEEEEGLMLDAERWGGEEEEDENDKEEAARGAGHSRHGSGRRKGGGAGELTPITTLLGESNGSTTLLGVGAAAPFNTTVGRQSHPIGYAAFILPNKALPPHTPMDHFLVPLTFIEAASGLQLFPELLRRDLSGGVASDSRGGGRVGDGVEKRFSFDRESRGGHGVGDTSRLSPERLSALYQYDDHWGQGGWDGGIDMDKNVKRLLLQEGVEEGSALWKSVPPTAVAVVAKKRPHDLKRGDSGNGEALQDTNPHSKSNEDSSFLLASTAENRNRRIRHLCSFAWNPCSLALAREGARAPARSAAEAVGQQRSRGGGQKRRKKREEGGVGEEV